MQTKAINVTTTAFEILLQFSISVYRYAEPAHTAASRHEQFGFDVSGFFTATLPSHSTSNGTGQASQWCKQAAVTPFNQLVFDTRKARNIASGNAKAARPAMGTMAWLVPRRGCDVIGKGYNNSPGIYDGSDYYQVNQSVASVCPTRL